MLSLLAIDRLKNRQTIIVLCTSHCLLGFRVGLCFGMHYLLRVLSNFVIILTRKRELVAFLKLSFLCLVTVDVLWLFFMVPWVGLQFVIVVFSDHTHVHTASQYKYVKVPVIKKTIPMGICGLMA